MANKKYVTSKQANRFAKIRQGLEEETGKTLEGWVIIARECPDTSHEKRLQWLKEHHGLGNKFD